MIFLLRLLNRIERYRLMHRWWSNVHNFDGIRVSIRDIEALHKRIATLDREHADLV